ncbi:MAG: GLUG motif-containing protein, partial [Planctomycetota bacterium]
MNKSLFIVFVLAFLVSSSYAKYSGGDGSAEHPYRIDTAADMQEIGATSGDWNKHFLMVNDINLADYTGTQFNIIGNPTTKFTGVFDGNNLEISNFTYHHTSVGNVGLFGAIGGAAHIENLGIRNVDVEVTGNSWSIGSLVGWISISSAKVSGCYAEGGTVDGWQSVGGLVGKNRGTIEDSHAAVTVSGTQLGIGGLTGSNSRTIRDSYATGDVSGTDEGIGGLVGRNTSDDGLIEDCHATGNVTGGDMVGGLVGDKERGEVIRCYATGDVETPSEGNVGGLVGENHGPIRWSFATGNVYGGWAAGGLVGTNGTGLIGGVLGTIHDSYATGSVWGTVNVGGLTGSNEKSSIYRCYSVGEVLGDSGVGGLLGANFWSGTINNCFWDVNSSGIEVSDGGMGKTTTEMHSESTYTDAGWDFVNESTNGTEDIWTIKEDVNYPQHVWP